MPKRKLEEELEHDFKQPQSQILDDEKIKKNSLDSDEEDDVDSDSEEKRGYKILDSDDIEGQEEGTAQFDGEVQITPFNMKEEMEEGHFDQEGHYHFNKRTEIRDNWLDNIDWVKIKKTEEPAKAADNSDSSDDEGPSTSFDKTGAYTKMLTYINPGETVGSALRRLGGGASLSASQKLKLKKQGRSQELTGDPVAVNSLTEIANSILNATGNMNIYQETYDQIKNFLNKAMKEFNKPIAEELDMYADDFEVKEKQKLEVTKPNEDGEKVEADTSESQAGEDNIVQWEFKWAELNEEIHGPHTSSQMHQWVKEGYFKDSVCVRKVGTDTFYSCRRVDFELYI